MYIETEGDDLLKQLKENRPEVDHGGGGGSEPPTDDSEGGDGGFESYKDFDYKIGESVPLSTFIGNSGEFSELIEKIEALGISTNSNLVMVGGNKDAIAFFFCRKGENMEKSIFVSFTCGIKSGHEHLPKESSVLYSSGPRYGNPVIKVDDQKVVKLGVIPGIAIVDTTESPLTKGAMEKGYFDQEFQAIAKLDELAEAGKLSESKD